MLASSERNFLRLLAERLHWFDFLGLVGLVTLLGLRRLGWPDHAVARAVAALVVGCLRIALRESVVPHATTALGAALLIGRQRARGDRDLAGLLGHRQLRSPLRGGVCRTLGRRGSNRARPTVATRIRDRRILERPGVLAVAIHLHPVLLVGVELVRDSEAHRGALERVRGRLLVVLAR